MSAFKMNSFNFVIRVLLAHETDLIQALVKQRTWSDIYGEQVKV